MSEYPTNHDMNPDEPPPFPPGFRGNKTAAPGGNQVRDEPPPFPSRPSNIENFLTRCSFGISGPPFPPELLGNRTPVPGRSQASDKPPPFSPSPACPEGPFSMDVANSAPTDGPPGTSLPPARQPLGSPAVFATKPKNQVPLKTGMGGMASTQKRERRLSLKEAIVLAVRGQRPLSLKERFMCVGIILGSFIGGIAGLVLLGVILDTLGVKPPSGGSSPSYSSPTAQSRPLPAPADRETDSSGLAREEKQQQVYIFAGSALAWAAPGTTPDEFQSLVNEAARTTNSTLSERELFPNHRETKNVELTGGVVESLVWRYNSPGPNCVVVSFVRTRARAHGDSGRERYRESSSLRVPHESERRTVGINGGNGTPYGWLVLHLWRQARTTGSPDLGRASATRCLGDAP